MASCKENIHVEEEIKNNINYIIDSVNSYSDKFLIVSQYEEHDEGNYGEDDD